MSIIEIEREAPPFVAPCEAATLDWVNEVREKYNIGPELEMLPVGFPSIASRCPVGQALHATAGYHSVTLRHWDDPDGWEVLFTPGFVREFMMQFDHGKSEHLLDPEYRAQMDGPCES